MVRYDCAIIGSGPAGLSAALNLKIRDKAILVLGTKGLSDKINKAKEINNYLGVSNVSGQKLNDMFMSQIDNLGIDIIDDKAINIYDMGKYFDIVTRNNMEYEASTIIIATGIQYGKYYKGEKDYIGRGVSYCTICDGMLYKNKTVAIVGDIKDCKGDIEFLSSICERVYYITRNTCDIFQNNKKIVVIEDELLEIKGENTVTQIITTNNIIDLDCIFIVRQNIMIEQLIPGIKIDKGHIIVDRYMKTNILRCFAAGDVTGRPYQIIKAAGEGNVASFSVLSYLDDKE